MKTSYPDITITNSGPTIEIKGIGEDLERSVVQAVSYAHEHSGKVVFVCENGTHVAIGKKDTPDTMKTKIAERVLKQISRNEDKADRQIEF